MGFPFSLEPVNLSGDIFQDKVLENSAPVSPNLANMKVRKQIELTGILQGIGFRPTVYRLAVDSGLAGWVINSPSGVIIEIEGDLESCDIFLQQLPWVIPFPGKINTMAIREVETRGEESFRIQPSLEGERSITPLPPDIAVCRECVEELFSPDNPRYLYPFITCTLCGPRFTVVRSFPYDRERTSMADFTMCQDCLSEYNNPADRRFHSQTNSCPKCGPTLLLTDNKGNPLTGDPITEAIALLKTGKILGIKGIGGFHLACDAHNDMAIDLLRKRKGRAEKPFAVMMGEIHIIRRYCCVSPIEEELLKSPVAPIVLLKAQGEKLAPSVAPLMGTLGVMLPYSPIHHLLFKHPEVPQTDRLEALIMTSGNYSEEPIVGGNDEALERLSHLVDGFLFHNRQIVLRADDSIYRVINGIPTVFRRSRGLVPTGYILSGSTPQTSHEKKTSYATSNVEESVPEPVILATGGDLKNIITIVKKNQVVPGPHIGDLASPVAQQYFKKSISVLTEYLEVEPNIIAIDPHPEYFSASLAREMNRDLQFEEVFHHHAHAVSLLFEHKLSGPALFVVFDGTGYGPDNTIWGGEFLIADAKVFERVAYFKPFPLPGGEAAIRDPIRILVGLLTKNDTICDEFLPVFGERINMVKLWLEAIRKGFNSPYTSSAGRLFDAAAAAVGFRRHATFEGQAAMWLEGIADQSESWEYEIMIHDSVPLIIDGSSLIVSTVKDILSGALPEIVSARFHNSLARIILKVSERIAHRSGLRVVGLTGGCFQNKFLSERAKTLLEKAGFTVLLHETVPPNDGGISIGQAIAARARHLGCHNNEDKG